MFIHTCDIGRAAGHEIVLDEQFCRSFLRELPVDRSALRKSGIYDEPRDVLAGVAPQTELLARLGRDSDWSPESS